MSERRTVTDEEGLALLESIVAERPDYVYQSPSGTSCFYVDPTNERPSCLVGHWMHRLDVPLTDMLPYEQESASALVGSRFNTSDYLATLLDEVQGLQDSGHPWGVALSTARERML